MSGGVPLAAVGVQVTVLPLEVVVPHPCGVADLEAHGVERAVDQGRALSMAVGRGGVVGAGLAVTFCFEELSPPPDRRGRDAERFGEQLDAGMEDDLIGHLIVASGLEGMPGHAVE